ESWARAKSTSDPTFGISDSTCATLRRRVLISDAWRIARCSASALRPCRAANCLSLLTRCSSTLRTIKLDIFITTLRFDINDSINSAMWVQEYRVDESPRLDVPPTFAGSAEIESGHGGLAHAIDTTRHCR